MLSAAWFGLIWLPYQKILNNTACLNLDSFTILLVSSHRRVDSQYQRIDGLVFAGESRQATLFAIIKENFGVAITQVITEKIRRKEICEAYASQP